MKKILLPILFVLPVILSIAQVDTVKRQTTTVIYSKVEYERTVSDKNLYNAVKMNPITILNGDFPFYYERRIADKVSVEGGVGFTTINYVQFYWLEEYFYDEGVKPLLGYSVMGSLKYYPSEYSKALEDIYFGPLIRYRTYKMEVPDYNSVGESFVETRNILDMIMSFGYMSYISDRVLIDFYGGIGLRKKDFILLDYDTSTNPSGIEEVNEFVPTIAAGLKLGFAF